MTHLLPARVTMIVCSVFADEVAVLHQAAWPGLVAHIEPSMLHVRPDRLGSHLDASVAQELAQGNKVLLVYGDCYAGMAALAAQAGVARTHGSNCAELLLGHAHYRRLLGEGAYFLLPEWARRGERFFRHELGLNRENATSLMRDLHRKIIYLDTGVAPLPEAKLAAIADYCGLPWQALPVGLEFLQTAIADALQRLEVQTIPS